MRNPRPDRHAADTTKSLLQDSLAKLGPHVIGIRLLLGDDHAYAIVVTASSRKKFVLPRLARPIFAPRLLRRSRPSARPHPIPARS